jgi:predicted nucleic acid-binding protein
LIYLDTSVLASFYWPEALSEIIDDLLSNEPEPALSQLVEVELFSALSRRVRMGEISQGDARTISAHFQSDLDDGFYHYLTVETVHYKLARDWISRFDIPLRTLDTLHLAIAFSYEISLITADEGLAASAKVLGVPVQILRL